jgi:hypothetical protein
MSSQEFLFDKRIVARNIALGLVEQKAVDKQIASLPDRESNATISQPNEEVVRPARATSDAEEDAAGATDADDDEE